MYDIEKMRENFPLSFDLFMKYLEEFNKKNDMRNSIGQKIDYYFTTCDCVAMVIPSEKDYCSSFIFTFQMLWGMFLEFLEENNIIIGTCNHRMYSIFYIKNECFESFNSNTLDTKELRFTQIEAIENAFSILEQILIYKKNNEGKAIVNSMHFMCKDCKNYDEFGQKTRYSENCNECYDFSLFTEKK